MTAAELAAVAGGAVVAGDPDVVVESFTNDSRAIGSRSCFVALHGHRDGHDFAADALEHGAVAVLGARDPLPGAPGAGRAVVVVPDPLAALGAAAASVRRALPDLEVVGITGSTGKTSTKDLTAAALGRARVVHANVDSFNNELGLPLTVLGAESTTEVLVVEMGARFPGNIAELCEIAAPTVGVLTNVGLAHAEHLGGPAGAARVKGELLDALPASGLAVVNADDDATPDLVPRSGARVVHVGRHRGADVRVRETEVDDDLRPRLALTTPWGPLEARLGVRGAHQVVNAAMAATVALALGVPAAEVAAGLADAAGSRWRMQLERSAGGVTVLNDAYNANPESTAAALRSLARLPTAGRRVAVLGTMLELGSHTGDAHAAIGRLVGELGIDALVAVGPGGALVADATRRVPFVARAADAAEALHLVRGHVAPGDAVLVKASRAVGLEHVAAGLLTDGPVASTTSEPPR